MACEICGNKPMNCDCTEGDKKAYDLEDELNQLKSEMSNEREQERKMLFKQVAVQLIPCVVPNEVEWIKNKDLLQKAKGLAEAILAAANEFAKGE